MRISKVVCVALAAAAGLLTAQAGAVAEPRIGTAVRVVKDVTADARALATGDGVNQNETVEVRADSLGELKLDDNTKLALGPGARLKLDKFVYDPAKSQGDVAVSLVKGAFRFVTGNAPKKDYKITTPSAAISVRGTVFDIFIADNGEQFFLLHEGSIEVCQGDGSDRSTCQVLQNVCNIIRVSAQGNVASPQGWNAQSSPVTFAIAFPFVFNPPTVDPVVYNTPSNIEANTCSPPQNPIQRTQYVPPSPPQYPDLPNNNAPPLPPEGPPQLPVPFSWTGFYVGFHGGSTVNTSNTNVNCVDNYTDGEYAFGIACSEPGGSEGNYVDNYASGFESLTALFNSSNANASGGVQFGGTMQFGIIVVGLEIDVSKLSGSDTNIVLASGSEFGNDTSATQSMSYLATSRVRGGMLFGNVLVFVTGGLAVGETTYGLTVANYGDVSKTVTQTGWVGGAGFEIALGLLTFRGEYLHFDLGDETLSVVMFEDGPAVTSSSFDNTGDTFRFAINFRLN